MSKECSGTACQRCGGRTDVSVTGKVTQIAGDGNCNVCGGKGWTAGNRDVPCAPCNGTGNCQNCGGDGCL